MTTGLAASDGSVSLASLAERIQALEDVESIKQITFRYCRAADKYDGIEENYGKRTAACFTDDGVWDGGVLGRFEGTEELAAFWGSEFQAKMTRMVSHMATNPLIVVTGDEATGEWHLLAQLIFGGEALWSAGRYENSYRRTSAGWRIREMKYTPWMWSRHLEGWARERFTADIGSLSG